MTGPDWGWPGWRSEMLAWRRSSRVPAVLSEAFGPIAELFGFAPASIMKDLFDAVGTQLVGRRVTLAGPRGTVALDLRSLRLTRPPVALMIGQLGDVAIEADNVAVAGTRLAAVRLTARNVQLQPDLGRATLVTAPVHARVELDEEVVADAVTKRMPQVSVELHDDHGRAYVTGHRSWGYVQVAPRVQGRTLILDPEGASIRGRSLTSLARRLPTARFTLGDDFRTAHLTDVSVQGARLVVDGVIEEWSVVLTPDHTERLVRNIRRYEGQTLRLPQDRRATGRGGARSA